MDAYDEIFDFFNATQEQRIACLKHLLNSTRAKLPSSTKHLDGRSHTGVYSREYGFRHDRVVQRVRGDLTGTKMIVINRKVYLEVVFCCFNCKYPIVKNSWDHVNAVSKDGLTWLCNNCDEESEEESDEESKE